MSARPHATDLDPEVFIAVHRQRRNVDQAFEILYAVGDMMGHDETDYRIAFAHAAARQVAGTVAARILTCIAHGTASRPDAVY